VGRSRGSCQRDAQSLPRDRRPRWGREPIGLGEPLMDLRYFIYIYKKKQTKKVFGCWLLLNIQVQVHELNFPEQLLGSKVLVHV
jgi:hypothetical protein